MNIVIMVYALALRTIWSVLPRRVKVMLYLCHRARIQNRKSVITQKGNIMLKLILPLSAVAFIAVVYIGFGTFVLPALHNLTAVLGQ